MSQPAQPLDAALVAPSIRSLSKFTIAVLDGTLKVEEMTELEKKAVRRTAEMLVETLDLEAKANIGAE